MRVAMLVSLPVVLFVLAAPLARAGKYNEVLNIGDQAPAWEKLPGTDGKLHSLADLADKEVVVVVFTCNSCPIAADYEDRLIAFAREHAQPDDKVALVAVNVNTVEADRLDKMRERAEQKGFNFPYLYDETQQIGREYGAIFTPEFFVLGKDRTVLYMGGMDNNSDPAQVTENYLEPAVAAALAGKSPATAETVARGCRVRYKRQRSAS